MDPSKQPPSLTVAAAKDYLLALKQRKAEAEKAERIDNSRLNAGSPMYYYCKLCGLLAETLPEIHFQTPKRHCDACQEMVDRGYSLTLKKFPGIDVSDS